jgi:hypothetical protein
LPSRKKGATDDGSLTVAKLLKIKLKKSVGRHNPSRAFGNRTIKALALSTRRMSLIAHRLSLSESKIGRKRKLIKNF